MFIAYFDISLKKLKNDLLLLCHYGIVSLFHPLRIICIIRPFFVPTSLLSALFAPVR